MGPDSFIVDLHMHSYWSFDGFVSPRDLLNRGHEMGLRLIAVTEHDNIDSWEEINSLQSLFPPLHVVPGIEITAMWGETVVGVLGIGFDTNDSRLNTFLSATAQEDKAFLDRWYKVAKEMGIGAIQDVVDTWILKMFPEFPERRHRYVPEWILTRLLWESGLVSDPWLAKEVNSRIVERAHHPPLPEVATAIQLIHGAKGIAILEHPSSDLSIGDVKDLMLEGFDGIELYHQGVDEELRQGILAIAKHNGWLVSAGSDHHGVRDGWGRRGQLLPHPQEVFEQLAEAISHTAAAEA